MEIPSGWIAAAFGAMATVVVALWAWGIKLLGEIKRLQDLLLDEKEEKVRILLGLKEEIDRKRGGGGTERRSP